LFSLSTMPVVLTGLRSPFDSDHSRIALNYTNSQLAQPGRGDTGFCVASASARLAVSVAHGSGHLLATNRLIQPVGNVISLDSNTNIQVQCRM